MVGETVGTISFYFVDYFLYICAYIKMYLPFIIFAMLFVLGFAYFFSDDFIKTVVYFKKQRLLQNYAVNANTTAKYKNANSVNTQSQSKLSKKSKNSEKNSKK